MAMNQSDIEQMIKEAIPDAEVQIEDLRGDGDHYAAYVRSAEFKGKTGLVPGYSLSNLHRGRE